MWVTIYVGTGIRCAQLRALARGRRELQNPWNTCTDTFQPSVQQGRRKGFCASHPLLLLSCFAQLDIWHGFCYTPNAELSFQATHSDPIRADFCPYKCMKLQACLGLEAEPNTGNVAQQWVNLKGFEASALLCSQGFTRWCPQLLVSE